MSTRAKSAKRASKAPASATTKAGGKAAASAGAQRDVVYDAIREALVLQTLPAGQKLSEPAWSEQLSVSRTAIREAFARLEAEGLIERAATAGYVVPELSAEDIAEITEVRLALECAAIDRICEMKLASRTSLKPMREAADQFARLTEEQYKLGAREADRRFHQEIINLSGNRRLIQLYRRAPLPLIHRTMSAPNPLRPSSTVIAEHEAIITHIAKGNASKARQLLRDHLLAGLAHLNG